MAIDGNKIRELRLEKNMTMEELGKACGVQRSAVNKWEKGLVGKIPYETMMKLCTVLDTPPAYILGLDYISHTNIKEQLKISKESGIPLTQLTYSPKEKTDYILEKIDKGTKGIQICNDYADDRPHFLPITTNGRKECLDVKLLSDVSESMSEDNVLINNLEQILVELPKHKLTDLYNYAKFLKSQEDGGD